MGNVFTIDASGALKELIPSSCEKESILESLIAEYPRILGTDTGSLDDDLRWMLIDRQFRLPGTRLLIDLLFVDQNGIPTIVEVKLAANPEIRRDVVGQVFQYGASIATGLSVQMLREAFMRRCENGGKDHKKELDDLLLDESQGADEFWAEVGKNLTAGRIRIVVVADEIPQELRTTLDFWGKQMVRADIFAIAIAQYTDKVQSLRILAPEIIGRRLGSMVLTREESSGSSLVQRPAEWIEAVQFNPDKAIQEFFLREAKTQRSSVTVRKLYYDADGAMRWRLLLNKSSVNMYQEMRFRGDLAFWKKMFPGVSIRTPNQGTQLSFNLLTVKDLEKFTETVRSADQKFTFLPRGAQGDIDA
jgi:hypothetical protein